MEKRKDDRRKYDICFKNERRKKERRSNYKENKKYGYVSICRSTLDWEWYQDVNVTKIFFHCLLKANWSDKKWE